MFVRTILATIAIFALSGVSASLPYVELSCDTWVALYANYSATGTVKAIQAGNSLTIAFTDTEIFENSVRIESGEFPTHLHKDTCENQGGGHWQVMEGGPADTTNEVWGPSMLDGNKKLNGAGDTTPGYFDAGVKSVVIHEKDGSVSPKRVCCDLKVQKLECDAFAPLADYTGYTADAKISVVQGDNTITPTLTINAAFKNAADTAFGFVLDSHLHKDTCKNAGGGHWQVVNGGAADTTNEVWVWNETLSDSTTGTFVGESPSGANVDLRLDAVSWVIHNRDDAKKMMCCDFFPANVASGGTTVAATTTTVDPGTGTNADTTAAATATDPGATETVASAATVAASALLAAVALLAALL